MSVSPLYFINGVLSGIILSAVVIWWEYRRGKKKRLAASVKKLEKTFYEPDINHLGELSMTVKNYKAYMRQESLETISALFEEPIEYKDLPVSHRRFLSPLNWPLDKEQRYAVCKWAKVGETAELQEMRRMVTAAGIFWRRPVPRALFLPDVGSYKYFQLLESNNSTVMVPEVIDIIDPTKNKDDVLIDSYLPGTLEAMVMLARRHMYDFVHNLPAVLSGLRRYSSSRHYQPRAAAAWPLWDVFHRAMCSEASTTVWNPFDPKSDLNEQARISERLYEYMKDPNVAKSVITACAATYGFKIPRDYIRYSLLTKKILMWNTVVPQPEEPKPNHLRVIK